MVLRKYVVHVYTTSCKGNSKLNPQHVRFVRDKVCLGSACAVADFVEMTEEFDPQGPLEMATDGSWFANMSLNTTCFRGRNIDNDPKCWSCPCSCFGHNEEHSKSVALTLLHVLGSHGKSTSTSYMAMICDDVFFEVRRRNSNSPRSDEPFAAVEWDGVLGLAQALAREEWVVQTAMRSNCHSLALRTISGIWEDLWACESVLMCIVLLKEITKNQSIKQRYSGPLVPWA